MSPDPASSSDPVAITSIAHCNVNCSDLARSRSFYETVLGLTVSSHTKPDPQDGSGFGLPGAVAWDAYMLHDHRGPFLAPVIDLLQWLSPPPAPRRDSIDAPGFSALRFAVPSVTELGQLAARLTELGIEAVRSDDWIEFTDPDGTRLLASVMEGGGAPLAATEFRGPVIGCSDPQRSAAWYADHLGFLPSTGGVRHPAQATEFSIAFEGRRSAPADWSPARANDLGIFRMAFMVSDIQAGYERLVAGGVTCFGPPVRLDMGPEIPIDGLWALFFEDPDGTCLELIESLR